MEGGEDQQPQSQPPTVVERLNPAVQQQLNLDSVKTRAISLFKAISRILEDFDAIARTNAVPRWQDTLRQFSMVNLELYNIVEDIKNVSKAFVVHPKNVNAENAAILPVMLSSKLLPEMEIDDNTKREQLLQSMRNLPVAAQIEKLNNRMDMIGSACESAVKIIGDTRKAYFGTRQGPTVLPTIDKVQAAKIQEQENLLRNAVNHGEALKLHGDQRQITSSLPLHLVDVLITNDGTQSFTDSSSIYQKNTPPIMSAISNNGQGSLLQASGSQLMGRAAASPSGAAGSTSFDNTTSPMQYANSPRSGTNIINTPSPQQQSLHHHQQQQLQLQQHQNHQRQKVMQLPPHQQQLLAQQQLRHPSMPGLGQMHGQHHVQFPQSAAVQQLQGRQLASASMHMGQNQLNQGSQLTRQLNQFPSPANSALFNAAQTTPTSQMVPNMSAMMPSQSVLPRMQQYQMAGGNRNLPSQNLNDQMFNTGATNASAMMPMQHGAFGNMAQSNQNLQSMQNTQQNHPNFQQQRQSSQQ